MDRYRVEVIWRYAKGHRQTAVHSTVVRCTSPERAEEWGKEALRRKFPGEEIEVVKATAQYEA